MPDPSRLAFLTLIVGGNFADSGASIIATNGTNGLTLQARTGSIGTSSAPVNADFGGLLNLITNAGNGAGNIFVLANQALNLGQNVNLTTGPGLNQISLQTGLGDITVHNFLTVGNLTLKSAADIVLTGGVSISAAALTLDAGNNLLTDINTGLSSKGGRP